jgi:hypothetical protein
MPLFSLLLDVPFEGSRRDTKELHNLGSEATSVHGSQNTLAYIL